MSSEAITTGIFFGFTLSFSAGPVMFALIQTSIKEGFWRALLMEVGIICSDAFFIIIGVFSLGQWIQDQDEAQNYILAGGGLALLAMGAIKVASKPKIRKHVREMAGEIKTHALGLLVRGFLFNTFNPSVILFWLGAVSIVTSKFEGDQPAVAAYFIATLASMFFFDVVKAWFAQKLKGWFSPRRMIYMDKVVGVVFMIFGGVLLLKGGLNLLW